MRLAVVDPLTKRHSDAYLKVIMQDQSARTWIWASLILQFLGYVLDAVWHGLLNPGVEPQTGSEMARHLSTVIFLSTSAPRACSSRPPGRSCVR